MKNTTDKIGPKGQLPWDFMLSRLQSIRALAFLVCGSESVVLGGFGVLGSSFKEVTDFLRTKNF